MLHYIMTGEVFMSVKPDDQFVNYLKIFFFQRAQNFSSGEIVSGRAIKYCSST